MNVVRVNYDKSDSFVAAQRKLGVDIFWDGWDMVIFHPAQRAVYSNKGVRHNNKWGFTTRIAVDGSGKWSVPTKYVKSTRATRG